MASKNKIAELILSKGEKIAVFTAAVLLGGLMLWGAITAFGGDSPATTAKNMTADASRVENAYRNTSGHPPEVEPRFTEGKPSEPVPPEEFAKVNARWFEPTIEPSRLRELPKVLTPEGLAQIDLIKGPMPSFDLVDDVRGGVMIGVLTTKTVGANEATKLRDYNRRLGNRANQRPGGTGAGGFVGAGPGGFGGAGPGGFGGAGPGGFGGAGPGGFGGAGPGGQGGGSPDGPGGMGGGPGGRGPGGMGPGGMGGGGFNNQMQRTETTVAYKTIDDFNKSNLPPALSVYPLRMVMVQAAFPLKKQFEEIRKALKLQSLSEAIQQSGYLSGKPLFDGLIVERQIVYPSGQVFPWAPFDHEVEYYNHIYRRQLETAPENGWTAYFTRYDQKIAVPLPRLNETLVAYPPISLDQIAAAAKKLEEANKPQLGMSDQANKFKGKSEGKGAADIFNPSFGGGQNMPGGVAGGFGPGEGAMGPGIGPRGGRPGGGMMPGAPPGGFGPGGQFGPGAGPGGFGPGAPPGGFGPGGQFGPGGFGQAGQPPRDPGQPPKIDTTREMDPNKVYPLDEDYLLIRFVDPTVQPGLTYQYRLKVKLHNPNFGLPKSAVSQASYATKEILESAWFPINQPIPIPSEMHVYSIDPAEHEKAIKEKFPRDNGMQALHKVQDGRQALVQIHRWMPEVRLGDTMKREPVGAWVIGEVQAAPGEYIGRKQLVQLPTWSAEKGYYVLKDLPEGLKLKGNITVKDIPRGWLVDMSTDNLLVDFDGGRFRGQIGDRTIQDESAQEILVLRPDGTMYVRNSEWEKDLKPNPRELRAKAWDTWLRTAEMMTPGSGSGFDRDRGGPGGPGGKGGAGGGGSGSGASGSGGN